MVFSWILAQATQPNENLSIFDPSSPSATSIRFLFILVLVITGGIFLVVEGVLIYSILKFRRPRNVEPGSEPPQVYGSKPIEIAWTAAPALIVFLLILILTRTEFEVRRSHSDPPKGSIPLYVTVIGHQWWWEYHYETYGDQELHFITANELHVPASVDKERPVYLTLQSMDVCHSFWIPRLAGKTDLIPGKINNTWFQTDKPGLYLGQCAEYCGTQHANMLLRVYVDKPEEFQAWLENEKKPGVSNAANQEGRAAFLAQSCVNCHIVRGATDGIRRTKDSTPFGPDLTHLMSRKTLASCMVDNSEKELRKWVADPQKTKVGCLMPAFGLNERDVDLVVKYLRTLE